jgi:hypothetical protein
VVLEQAPAVAVGKLRRRARDVGDVLLFGGDCARRAQQLVALEAGRDSDERTADHARGSDPAGDARDAAAA